MDYFVFYKKDIDAKKDFQRLFNIDLDDTKYNIYQNIEEKWNAIIFDIYGSNDHYDINDCYLKFENAISQMISTKYSCVIRTGEDQYKKQEMEKRVFKKLIQKLIIEIEKYPIYEADVWMNTLLSMEYNDWYKKQNELQEATEDSKGIYVPDEYGNVSYKNQEFKVPFGALEEWQFAFLGKFGKKMLSQNIMAFATEYTEGEKEEVIDGKDVRDVMGYAKRVKLSFLKDKRYERWSEKKMSICEEELGSSLKDQILMQKTINSLLCRNIVDKMIESDEIYHVEDFCYLMECLTLCRSLAWQNLIGCLFTSISYRKSLLESCDILEDIYLLLEVWIKNIDRINRYTSCLSNGLLYLLKKYDRKEISTVLQDKAVWSLNTIKNILNLSDAEQEKRRKARIKRVWDKQPVVLRMTMDIADEHTDFWWIYAILQRYIISSIKSSRDNWNRQKDKKTDWTTLEYLKQKSKIVEFSPLPAEECAKLLKERMGKRE